TEMGEEYQELPLPRISRILTDTSKKEKSKLSRRVCESVRIRGKELPKTRTALGLPKIFAFHLDNAAHFVQPRPHSSSTAIAQGFRARSGACWRQRPVRSRGRLILKI